MKYGNRHSKKPWQKTYLDNLVGTKYKELALEIQGQSDGFRNCILFNENTIDAAVNIVGRGPG